MLRHTAHQHLAMSKSRQLATELWLRSLHIDPFEVREIRVAPDDGGFTVWIDVMVRDAGGEFEVDFERMRPVIRTVMHETSVYPPGLPPLLDRSKGGVL